MQGNTYSRGNTLSAETRRKMSIAKLGNRNAVGNRSALGRQNAKKYDNPTPELRKKRERGNAYDRSRRKSIKDGMFDPTKVRKKSPPTIWTNEEKVALVKAFREHGKKWTFIASNVPLLARFSVAQVKHQFQHLWLHGHYGIRK